MENQHERLNGENDAQENAETGNAPKSNITKLKEKFMPSFKITLLISLALNFIMLVIGAYGVHKCPVNENIPLFLLATGGIGLFSKFISYLRDKIQRLFEIKYVESTLYTVETIFLGFGMYWVLKEYKPSFDVKDDNYCNKTVYLFAFVYLMILITFLIVLATGFLCFLICIFFVERTKSTEPDPESQAHIETNSENTTQQVQAGK